MKIVLTLFSALFAITTIFGQTTEKQNPIDDQFESLIEKSNNYQEFKVVKKSSLRDLKSNTSKHISELNSEISELKSTIENQKQSVDGLNTQLTDTQNDLATVTEEKASISLLGMQLRKGTYNAIVWSIIGLLIVGLLFFIIQFKKSNAETQLAKDNLKTSEQELEEIRRKSLEKEQKLGRQLQDERNKLTRIKQS